jgi:hypothetical protein
LFFGCAFYPKNNSPCLWPLTWPCLLVKPPISNYFKTEATIIKTVAAMEKDVIYSSCFVLLSLF